MEAYDPDCLFADPFAGFNGVDRFKQNVSNLGGLLWASSIPKISKPTTKVCDLRLYIVLDSGTGLEISVVLRLCHLFVKSIFALEGNFELVSIFKASSIKASGCFNMSSKTFSLVRFVSGYEGWKAKRHSCQSWTAATILLKNNSFCVHFGFYASQVLSSNKLLSFLLLFFPLV